MSESCDRINFWNALVDSCLQIMDLIDWERSHPDDVHDLTVAYGIDVAWEYFLCVSSGCEMIPCSLVIIFNTCFISLLI